MSLSLHALAVDTFAPMLESLSGVIDAGAAHAAGRGGDLPSARLAPDMFTLAEQVQTACRQARDAMARLSGREPDPGGLPGATVEDLKSQISATVAALRAYPASAFDGAEARDCTIHLPVGGSIPLTADQYLTRWALPHFYFHVVTAYDIVRHLGAPVGKRDYLSSLAPLIRT